MKNIILAFIVFGAAFGVVGCKYDDSYLDAKLPKNIAYFASFQEYTRTVIVGEGMNFKIGASMAGSLSNTEDRTVDLKIFNYVKKSFFDKRVMLADSLFKINNLPYVIGSEIRTVIPAGKFTGYFDVNIDSAKFLKAPLAKDGNVPSAFYTLPVRIVRTSLDSIGSGNDSVFISVKYQAAVDGYYLYDLTVRKEFPTGSGIFDDTKTQKDKYINENDNSTFRLLTRDPFKVEVTAPLASIISGLKFNMTVAADKTITYDATAVSGQPLVTPELTNVYDSKTRDFDLYFKYRKLGSNDTTYHVNAKMIFRNRTIDNFVQTREYLSYINK